MSGESFEWAIKKDVRNNPIVREVDLERHRDMWRSVGFSLFLRRRAAVRGAGSTSQLQQYGYHMEETPGRCWTRNTSSPDGCVSKSRRCDRRSSSSRWRSRSCTWWRPGPATPSSSSASSRRPHRRRRSSRSDRELDPPWPNSPIISWRRTLKRRLACRGRSLAPLVRGHRGAARLSAGLPVRLPARSGPINSSRTRFALEAKRGDILDRNGELLAYNVDADTVCAAPARSSIRQTTINELCQASRTARARSATSICAS